MALTLPSLRAVFQALPLRRRLSVLIATCAGLTALLCLLAVAGTGWWLQASRADEEATEVVRTMAFALEAPVAFDDAKGVTDALALLRGRPQVSAAWVFDGTGKQLGRYGQGGAQPPPAAQGGLLAGYLIASQDIVNDGRLIGRVVVVNGLSRLWQSLGIAAVAIALGSALALAVSVQLARRVARAIAEPVATLARASREIAASHAYGTRLPDFGNDEIGQAVRAFNDMLDEIGRRGQALEDANRELERRVADRTQALQREKERAEAASVAKTRFLANMSHELRTPLNAVIGAAQLLKLGDEAQESQAYLVDAIKDSGLNLLGLIENILDLSRIETGALELAPEDFNLLDCVESAVAPASVTARAKGLAMACIFSPDLPAWRHGDPLRVRQILLNLLGNAVKFTLTGEVVVRVEKGTLDHTVRVVVSDTGIGIGAASLDQIFQPFRQADDRSNRRFGGSGLGLAIASQLVAAMGGILQVRSQLGQGSTFEAEVALLPARDAVVEPPPMSRQVVVLEPHDASARALEATLQRLGCPSTRCRTVAEVHAWLDTQVASAAKPWLLVAAEDSRTWAALGPATGRFGADRVIGMTRGESLAARLQRERLEVGHNLMKPVLRSALVSRFGALDQLPMAGSARVAPDVVLSAAGKRVLVVEDDHVNQTIVCAMLHNAGYRATVAADGAQALALLASRPFELVLMDWQMPDMDGLEVTRRMRAGEAGARGTAIPIIALTANAFVEDRAACFAAGMNDFLTKPVLATSLEATVARWANGAPPHGPATFRDSMPLAL